MKMENCPSFKHCSAPLCPLDPELPSRNWFPDEPICHRYPNLSWIKKQKKLLIRLEDKFYLKNPYPLTLKQIKQEVKL